MEESVGVMRTQKGAIKESFTEATLDLNLEGRVGVHSGPRHIYTRGKNQMERNLIEARVGSGEDRERTHRGGQGPRL